MNFPIDHSTSPPNARGTSVRNKSPLGSDPRGLLIVLATTWAATQWTAWQLGFQPQLGRSWFELFGWPPYHPPAFFWWWYFYDAYAPSVFVEGAYIAASGGFIAIAVTIGHRVLPVAPRRPSDRKRRPPSDWGQLDRRMTRMERDLGISAEMLAAFVRFWLTTYPSLPEPAHAAARAQAGERYDAFVVALGRRLAKGPKLREEISEDVTSVSVPEQ